MHFNGLIMQFRLQVLGGAGAIGTIAGYLINANAISELKQRERLRAMVAGGLSVLILSAALLDLFYYRQLLEGSVNAIIDFERQHPTNRCEYIHNVREDGLSDHAALELDFDVRPDTTPFRPRSHPLAIGTKHADSSVDFSSLE